MIAEDPRLRLLRDELRELADEIERDRATLAMRHTLGASFDERLEFARQSLYAIERRIRRLL